MHDRIAPHRAAPNRVVQDRVAVALSKTRLFAPLSSDALTELAGQCRFLRFEPQQQIIGYHDDSADVFFIVSGAVRIAIHSAHGKEISYRDVEACEMFGELAAIDGKQRSASVIALADTVVVVMPGRVFLDALHRHPSVSVRVLERLTGLVRLYSQRLYEIRTLDVQHRIRAELLRMAEDSVNDDNTAVISPLPTHSTIANRVCTRREAVSRELADLARQGLIEREQETLTIRDFSRLSEMVESVLGE